MRAWSKLRRTIVAMAAVAAVAIVGTVSSAPPAQAAATRVGSSPNFNLVSGANVNIAGTTLLGARDSAYSSVLIYAVAGERVGMDLRQWLNWDRLITPGRVQLIDPAGHMIVNTAMTYDGSVQQLGGTFTSNTTGVWELRVSNHQVNTATGYLPADIRWDIAVLDSTLRVAKPGRVFSESWSIQQVLSDGGYPAQTDLRFWAIGEYGAMYRVDLGGYNGNESSFQANNVGNALKGTCEPVNKSVPLSSPELGGIDQNYWQPSRITDCSGLSPYALFLDAPNNDLPASVANWADRRTTDRWVKPSYVPAGISGLTYTRAGAGQIAGTLRGTTAQSGYITLQVDVNGNGNYTEAIDASVEVYVAKPGSFAIAWDGKNGSGAAVSAMQTVNFRAVMQDASPIHFLRIDSEASFRGIAIEQLVGPQVGNSTIFWDDSLFTNSSGSRYSKTSPLASGASGRSSAGGVHRWSTDDSSSWRNASANDGVRGSWGDARSIDDWSFVRENVSAAMQLRGLTANLQVDLSWESGVQLSADGRTATYNYWIDVRNSELGTTATNVTATIAPPSQVTTAQVRALATPTRGSYNASTGVWSLGSVTANTAYRLRLSATVPVNGERQFIRPNVIVDSPDSRYTGGTTINSSLAADTDQYDAASTWLEPAGVSLSVDVSTTSHTTTSDGNRDVLVWQVQVRNDSFATTSTSTSVALSLPSQVIAGTARVSTAATHGSVNLTSGAWTIGNLAAGATATVRITGEVRKQPNASTTVVHAVTATSSQSPYGGGRQVNVGLNADTDQFDSITNVVGPDVAELRIHKTPGAVVVFDGDQARVTWQIQVQNASPDTPALATIVSDTYPAGVTASMITVATQPTQGTFTASSGRWNIGTLATNTTATISLTATVDLASASRILRNTVTVDSSSSPYRGGTTSNSSLAADTDQYDHSDATVPAGRAVLQIDVHQPGALTTSADGLTHTRVWQIDVRNAAKVTTAASTRVEYVLPSNGSGTALVGSPSQGTFSIAGRAWSIGSLAPGQTATVRFSQTYSATPGNEFTQVSAHVYATGLPYGGGTQANTGLAADTDQYDRSSFRTPVPNPPVLKVDVQHQAGPNVASDGRSAAAAWNVLVRNDGPTMTATETLVTLDLPDGHRLIQVFSVTQGSADLGAETWDVGTLAVGQTATLVIRAEWDLAAASTATLQAYAESSLSTYGGGRQVNDSLNTDTDAYDRVSLTIPAFEPPTLRIDAYTSGAPVVASDGYSATVTWVVDVRSDSARVTARNVEVSLAFLNADHGSLVSRTATAGTVDAQASLWRVGSLAPGVVRTATIVQRFELLDRPTNPQMAVTMKSDEVAYAGGTQMNVGLDADSDRYDRTGIGIRAIELPTLRVDVVKVAGPNLYDGGTWGAVGWQVWVRNDGPSMTSLDTVVTFTQPEGARVFQLSSMTKGTADLATSTWGVGTLAVGESARLSVRAEWNLTDEPQPVAVEAFASSRQIAYGGGKQLNVGLDADIDSWDRETVNVPALAAADVRVDVAAPTNIYAEDGTFVSSEWIVTAANASGATATAVDLQLRLDMAGIDSTMLGTTSRGKYDAASRVWTIGNLVAGERVTLTLSGQSMVAVTERIATVEASGSALNDPYPGGEQRNESIDDDLDQYDAHDMPIRPAVAEITVDMRSPSHEERSRIPAGERVQWVYDVENVGNIVLDDVVVSTDRKVQVSCPSNRMLPGATMQCTGSGVLNDLMRE